MATHEAEGAITGETVMLIVTAIQPMLVSAVTSAVAVATTKIVTELRKDLLVVDELRKEIESLKSQQAQITKQAIDTVQQQIYLSCKMDIDEINSKSEKLQSRVSDLESTNKTIQNELDDLEQYSRRNCLVFHGINESDKNTTDAVVKICQTMLHLPINSDCIDRSHRLGRLTGEARKPRPVIVKLTSYAPRQDIFMSKRQLKGSKITITESLTKRRTELMLKARSMPNVTTTWTVDGRIVCLLTNGKKLSVTTEQQLRRLNEN